MKKMFLAAALAASMCVPVYANFDDNSDASIYFACLECNLGYEYTLFNGGKNVLF